MLNHFSTSRLNNPLNVKFYYYRLEFVDHKRIFGNLEIQVQYESKCGHNFHYDFYPNAGLL